MNGLKRIELRAYENWIELNVIDEELFMNCSLWVRVMRQAFPELTIVFGSVRHRYARSAYHEYLITEDGEIVDPTRKQFDSMFGDNWSYNRLELEPEKKEESECPECGINFDLYMEDWKQSK